MAYGTLKCDNITFTNGGIDQTVTVSGIVQSISGNITATGTIQAATIIGTSTVSGATVTGNAGVFTTVTGGSAGFTTVTGTTVTGTTANFATISGTTITGSVGNFGSGSAAAPSVSVGTTNNGLYSPGTDQVALSTNGIGRLFVDASGNVGVGTSTITGKLSLGASQDFVFGNQSSTGTGGTGRLVATGGEVYIQAGLAATAGSNAPIIFTGYGGVGERLRITAAGLVGVGTSSPTQKLDLDSGGNTTAVYQAFTGGNERFRIGYSFTSAPSGTDVFTSILTNSSGQLLIADRGAASGGTVFYTGGTERARIDSSGRVGIGASSPGSLLQVGQGTASTYTDFAIIGATTANYGPKISLQQGGSEIFEIANYGRVQGGTSSDVLVETVGSNKLQLGTNRTVALTIDSSQQVGIGTTSPDARFTIQDGTNNILKVKQVAFDNYTNEGAGLTFGRTNDGVEVMSIGVVDTTRLLIASREGVLFGVGGGGLYSAVSEAARIDSSGRLLVGTSSARGGFYGDGTIVPNFQLEGASSSYNNSKRFFSQTYNSATSYGPGFYLTKTRATSLGGFAIVNSGDELGSIVFSGADGTTTIASATITAYVDGTPGTNDMPGRLVFSTTADGASSPTERMRITSDSDGHLLVASTNASNSSNPGIKLKGGSASTVDVVINAATNINLNHVYNVNATNNGYRYYLSADGGIRNFSSNNSNLCDEREKKNITALEDKWDKVRSWELKKFHYIGEPDTADLRYGVIAQQVETECPEVLTSWLKQDAREAELDDDGNVVTPAQEQILRKGVKEQQMMWMAIKVLQEAQVRIETLEAEVAALKAS